MQSSSSEEAGKTLPQHWRLLWPGRCQTAQNSLIPHPPTYPTANPPSDPVTQRPSDLPPPLPKIKMQSVRFEIVVHRYSPLLALQGTGLHLLHQDSKTCLPAAATSNRFGRRIVCVSVQGGLWLTSYFCLSKWSATAWVCLGLRNMTPPYSLTTQLATKIIENISKHTRGKLYFLLALKAKPWARSLTSFGVPEIPRRQSAWYFLVGLEAGDSLSMGPSSNQLKECNLPMEKYIVATGVITFFPGSCINVCCGDPKTSSNTRSPRRSFTRPSVWVKDHATSQLGLKIAPEQLFQNVVFASCW